MFYVGISSTVYVHIHTLDDDSRVKVRGGVTDYINASYIDVNHFIYACLQHDILLFQLFRVYVF